MSEQFRIEILSSHHDRTRFISGSESLDRYLREQVSQDVKRRIASCFIAVSVSTAQVAGFYTIAATSVALEDFAPAIIKKLPRYPVVPAALLGRLAVARHTQGKGLGGVLLADAVLRLTRAELGIFALLVDAKDDAAQRFYEHYGFTLLPGAERRLCLPIDLALLKFGSERHA